MNGRFINTSRKQLQVREAAGKETGLSVQGCHLVQIYNYQNMHLYILRKTLFLNYFFIILNTTVKTLLNTILVFVAEFFNMTQFSLFIIVINTLLVYFVVITKHLRTAPYYP